MARELPVSVIVIDWQHWVHQGDWTFNPTCWPDPQGMVDELTSYGIELMTTFWPLQTVASTHWAQFNGSGYLAVLANGTSSPYDGSDQWLVDTTNANARAAMFDGFWQGYGRLGVRAVWLDAAEPEHFGGGLEGQWRLAAGTDGEVGMAWAQQHVRAFSEGFAGKGLGPSDVLLLPRHAWAGSWRYSAALWSGDIVSTFAELQLQVRVLQGTMMSGVSLWTTDIGGWW